MRTSQSWLRRSAAFGAFVWVTIQWFIPWHSTEITLTSRLVLLAILVNTPLAMSLIKGTYLDDALPLPLKIAEIFQPFAAILAAISFVVTEGVTAAAFVSPWLLVTGLIALGGLIRLLKRIPGYSEAAMTAGMLYFPVGGAWLIASRLGYRPLGFGIAIVLLTAMHFHYAGFAASVITSMVGRMIGHAESGFRVAYKIVAVGVIIGTPLLAAGITFSPALEVVAASILALSLIGLSILIVSAVVPVIQNATSRWLLLFGSVFVFGAMIFAAAYSIGSVSGHPIVSIPQMVQSHGIANAFGFTLCSLLGFSIYQSSVNGEN